MTDLFIPEIQDVEKAERGGLLHIKRKDIRKFLKDKELPITKLNIRKARRRLKRQKRRALPKGKDVSYAQADAPWQIIYGRFKTGGIISFIYINPDTKHLHLVVTYACHEVNAVKGLFLDDKQVSFPNGVDRWCDGDFAPGAVSRVFMATQGLGSPSQVANTDLIGQLPAFWTSTDKQSNRAHVYLILLFHNILFAEGMPEIILEIEGKKLYDPRDATTLYKTNAALVAADYLTDTNFGMGVAWADIDTSTNVGGLQWAANICDEAVPLKAGGTEPRYQINGAIDAGVSPQEVLEEMALSMAGNIVFIDSKWRFFPGKYVTPTITLTEDDLLSPPTINRLVSKSEIFNTVRGQFVSIENNYEVTDYPPSSNSTYVNEDGGERFYDMPFNLVTSGTQCQRCAKIELEETRREQSFEADFGLKAYSLLPGDTVMLSMPRYGYSSKVFLVEDYKFFLDSSLIPTITLVLHEIDSNAYNWNETIDENSITQAPATSLPNPESSGAPTALVLTSGTDELYKRSDGTIFSRMKVAWTPPTDIFVTESGKIQIQYKLTSSGSWSNAIEVDGDQSFTHILDVKDSSGYDVRIRSKNGIGSFSDWVTGSHTVVGKTAKPANVTGFVASLQELAIRLSWNASSEIDFDYFEIRRGGASWEAATFLDEIKGTKFVDNYKVAGSTTYWIKAVDTTKNKSDMATATEIIIVAPNVITELRATTVDNNVLLDWEVPAPSSLPVATYRVYKGDTFLSAVIIGTVDASFHTYLETVGGEYTYWITAIDTAGNEGAELSVITTVFDPPDYVLQDYLVIPVADGTLVNCKDSLLNTLVAPINTTETWAEHFTNNSKTTFQDFIDASYPIYAQPTPGGTSTFEYEKDYGVILPASALKFTWSNEVVSGVVTATPKIEVKEDIGDAWTVYNASSAFTIAFRYARYTLTFTGSADTAIARFSNITVKIDVKKSRDGGNGVSSASGWTVVTFNKDFIDVINLNAMPANSSGDKLYAFVKYDWASPDVDQFEVQIFNSSGTQVAERFSWFAEGVIRPPV